MSTLDGNNVERIVKALESIANNLSALNKSVDLITSDFERHGDGPKDGVRVTLLDAVLRISAELAAKAVTS